MRFKAKENNNTPRRSTPDANPFPA
jgi:hypothetical protein